MTGIGHNNGPAMRLGRGWHTHCWKQARKELLGKTLPIEVVRTRIRRARELGLAYPQYASILLGSGRDIVGFLFTVDGLQLRLQRQLSLPDTVQEKLQGLKRTDLFAFAPSGESPEMFRAELTAQTGLIVKSSAPEPERTLNWPEARRAVRAVLDPVKVPSGAVVLIGTKDAERDLAMAGKLARFIPSDSYFEQGGANTGWT
nr:hypothetical protein [Amylibacter sp.]